MRLIKKDMFSGPSQPTMERKKGQRRPLTKTEKEQGTLTVSFIPFFLLQPIGIIIYSLHQKNSFPLHK